MSKKLYFLEDMVGKHADAIIVLDNKNKERVKNRFSHTAFVLRPGVDVAYWSQKISSDKQYVNKIVLLSVGKLHPQKNQILLVDVVASLLPKIPSIHLILVGKGPDEERIKKRIRQIHLEKYITLAGSVDNATLRKLYHTAFIVCFPALDQTWGLTPFEALCQKTVSIVSSEAGSAEVLKPHHLSLIANPSLHDFAQTILDAYKNKSKVEIIGQRGYAYVKENLQWDNFCKDAEMILNKTYNKI